MAKSSGIRAGRAFVELGVNDKLAAGLKRAEQRLKAFGATVQSIGLKLAGIGAAVLGPLAAAVKVFASAGDALAKMAQRTGFSVESLSELGFAAEQSGTNIETLENGIRTLQRSINDAERGLSTATDGFAALGLSAAQLRALSPEQQFKAVAEQLSKIEDPAKRAAVAMQLLGRSGTQLLPMIENGAAGIEELQKQARALGLTITTEMAADAARLTDILNILWRVVKQGAIVVGSSLVNEVISLSEAITRAVVTTTAWIRENKAMIVTAAKIAAAVLAAGLAIAAVGTSIIVLGALFGSLTAITSAAAAAFGVAAALIKVMGLALAGLLSPIGLVITAVAALGAAVAISTGAAGKLLEWLGGQFARLRKVVQVVIGGIADALAAGDIALAAKVLWAGLNLAWQRGTDGLERIWIDFSSAFQRVGISAFASLQRAWINVRDWFRQEFPEFTRRFSQAWASAVGFFKGIWATAQAQVEKGINAIHAAVDDSLDLDTLNRMTDESLAKRVGDIDEETAAQRKEADRVASLTPEQLEQERQADLAGVDDSERRQLDALEQRTADRISKAKQELEDARQSLAAAREDARQRREEQGGDDAPGESGIPDWLQKLLDGIEGAGQTIERRATRGTFNAAAIQSLLSDGAAERTAKATEETARNTKKLADRQTGGLAFG